MSYIMAASCGTDNASVEQMQEMGLVAAHAYTLIAVAMEVDENGETVRLVKLRNPWGKFEWNGDWSDESSLWTEELKEAVGMTSSDDGTFWMSFEDLQRYF